MFEQITDLISEHGYFGIAFLMFLENVFPPIPSELIMPMAGFVATKGDLSLPLVVLSGSLGSLMGGSIWYYLGRWVGRERLKNFAGRHGRFLTVTPAEIDRAIEWFTKHGAKSVLLGRLVPAVRSLISLPAGIVRMAMPKFLLYSALGTILWTGALAIAGHQLKGQYEAVSSWLDPVTNIVVAGLLITYVYRVITYRQR